MSEEVGSCLLYPVRFSLVGAKTFAAVRPCNNGKMAADLAKLANRPESHRYVFFPSPTFPGKVRLPKFEQNGVQVWSIDV